MTAIERVEAIDALESDDGQAAALLAAWSRSGPT